MPSNDPRERFADIVANIERIRSFTAGYDAKRFASDERTVYAVKHALLIISEAARKLLPAAEELCPGIAWPEIRALGNRLRHEYETVDLIRIWLIVDRDLRPLDDACRAALQLLEERR